MNNPNKEKICITIENNKINGLSANNLTFQCKDAIYREVWKERVIEDIESRLEERSLSLNEDAIDTCATRYVYEGDYDCNLSYWANLDNLIDEYL